MTLDCEANWSPVRRPPSTKGEDEGECEGGVEVWGEGVGECVRGCGGVG